MIFKGEFDDYLHEEHIDGLTNFLLRFFKMKHDVGDAHFNCGINNGPHIKNHRDFNTENKIFHFLSSKKVIEQ